MCPRPPGAKGSKETKEEPNQSPLKKKGSKEDPGLTKRGSKEDVASKRGSKEDGLVKRGSKEDVDKRGSKETAGSKRGSKEDTGPKPGSKQGSKEETFVEAPVVAQGVCSFNLFKSQICSPACHWSLGPKMQLQAIDDRWWDLTLKSAWKTVQVWMYSCHVT